MCSPLPLLVMTPQAQSFEQSARRSDSACARSSRISFLQAVAAGRYFSEMAA